MDSFLDRGADRSQRVSEDDEQEDSTDDVEVQEELFVSRIGISKVVTSIWEVNKGNNGIMIKNQLFSCMLDSLKFNIVNYHTFKVLVKSGNKPRRIQCPVFLFW